MAEGKWIDGLEDDTPATDAARHVLDVRLHAVRDHLPRALFEAEQDIEHIHRLRVATRRAGAALRIFKDFLPKKLHQRMAGDLRLVRRAAGEARDWDVFTGSLGERLRQASAAEQPGLDLLMGLSHANRWTAQSHLQEAAQKPLGRMKSRIKETLAGVRASSKTEGEMGFKDLAGPRLASLLEDFEAAAASELADYAHLHRVRILGKRLRYAMEIFAGCFDPVLREEYYPAVERMQDMLGLANDSHVARKRLEMIRDWVRLRDPQGYERYRPGMDGLILFHQERLPRQRAEFERWWAAWRRSGAERGLARLLASASGEAERLPRTVA